MDICTILIILLLNAGGEIEYPHEFHPMRVHAIMRKAERCYRRYEEQHEPFEPVIA